MQSLHSSFPTPGTALIGAMVLRWLSLWLSLRLSVCGVCLLVGAAGVAAADTGKLPVVSQGFWLDTTLQMTLEDAQQADFTALDPGQRQKFSEGVGWARLRLEGKPAAESPLLLQVRPAFFTRLTVFSPPDKPGSPWVGRELSAQQLTQPFAMGVSKPGDTVYVRVESLQDMRLIVSAGSAQALNAQQRQIDVVVVFFITLMLAFVMAMVMQGESDLKWLRRAMYLFSVSAWTGLLLFTGYGQSLAGLEPAQSAMLLKRVSILVFLGAGLVWILSAKQIFPQSRWMNWLFVGSAAQLLLWFASWIDLALAFHIAERLLAPAAWTHVLFLLAHAIRDPAALSEKSSKTAFFVLLVMAAAFAVTKTAVYVGGSAFPNSLSQQNLAAELMLRGSGALVYSLLIYFLLLSTRRQRLSHLQSALHHTQGSLALEKQRLERQLKFNVMLSHELKNPLMASQMALSNLQRQLEPAGPPRQSAETIEHSLQTIDDIIERCAEIDAYESDSEPLTVDRFTVAELLACVRAAHKSERIYIVTRRLDDTLLLNSDMQYLKVILNNLLTNAVKYSEPDTLVELLLVRDTETPAQLAFCVSNTVGVAGVPDPAQVFERYYRSEGARQQPGTGQGLWLAQSMAQALGSRISLKVDGKAVTFGFSLPTH